MRYSSDLVSTYLCWIHRLRVFRSGFIAQLHLSYQMLYFSRKCCRESLLFLSDYFHGLLPRLFCPARSRVRSSCSSMGSLYLLSVSNSKSRSLYLTNWEFYSRDVFVLPVVSWMALIHIIQTGWWKIKTSPPFLNNFLTMFLNSLHLTQTLQCSIMSFIQFPALN